VADDAERIAGMLRGDPGAFTGIYREYGARLLQYARTLVRSPMEAEDVVHDVMLAVARRAGEGRMPRDLASYLYVSVRNRCFDRLRRSRKFPVKDVDLELIEAPPGDVERAGLREGLNRALAALPPEQAEVVVLRTWHGMDFAAIADLQDTSVNTALSRYRYGLSKLQKEMGIHG